MTIENLKGTSNDAINSTHNKPRNNTMTHIVLAEVTASVSELKKNPMGTVAAGDGAAVAILNRNEPAFYCVPASAYEAMIERLDDLELNAIADARANDPVVKVTLDEL